MIATAETVGSNRVYFTDRDLGKQFPEILRAAGLVVERHADHFEAAAPDQDWLAEVGRRGWVALSHDRRIRYKPNEKAAVIRHNVMLLVLIGAAPFPDLARGFVATLPRVEAFLAEHTAPFIAKVYRPSPGKAGIASSRRTPPSGCATCSAWPSRGRRIMNGTGARAQGNRQSCC